MIRSSSALPRGISSGLRFLLFLAGAAGAMLCASEEAAPVTFTGYNLRNYLRMERRIDDVAVPNAPKPEAEIAAVVALLSSAKPDILGVTEMGTQEDLEDFRLRLERAGISLPHTTLALGADQERHIALLSRFPITAVRHQTNLTYRIGAVRFPMQRGILDAAIAVPDGYLLRVLGVHLKSKRPVEEADQAEMRRHEAHLLRRYLVEILKEDPAANLLVFGDFNGTRDEASIIEIQGRAGTEGHFRDVRAADEFGFHWTYYWESADQYSRFDYLFVSPGLAREILWDSAWIPHNPAWLTASDHRPLVVRLRAEDR